MDPETKQVFSWLLATTFPPAVTAATVQVAAHQFKEFSRERPRKGWMIDASTVTEYDPSAFPQIQSTLESLAIFGLRYVGFVQPNELARAFVSSMIVPVLRIRGFATPRDAEAWFRRSCV